MSSRSRNDNGERKKLYDRSTSTRSENYRVVKYTSEPASTFATGSSSRAGVEPRTSTYSRQYSHDNSLSSSLDSSSPSSYSRVSRVNPTSSRVSSVYSRNISSASTPPENTYSSSRVRASYVVERKSPEEKSSSGLSRSYNRDYGSREREREKTRDIDNRDRDRDRDRERERDRDRDNRDRERDREREKNRDNKERDRDRDYYSSGRSEVGSERAQAKDYKNEYKSSSLYSTPIKEEPITTSPKYKYYEKKFEVVHSNSASFSGFHPSDSQVDHWLSRLFKRENLLENELKELCEKTKEIFQKENNIKFISGPATIVGDIHGQWFDLVHRVFALGSDPLSSQYIFLGDYVDRGLYSLEVISLILTLKLKFPDSIILLRGNHESRQISQIDGFYDQIYRVFGSSVIWQCFMEVFDWLPISVVIGGKYFATHGGLSPKLEAVNDILYIERNKEIPDSGPMCDLMWSDPDEEVSGFKVSPRGSGWLFGPDVSQRWNHKNGLEKVIRAHQLVYEGYLYGHNDHIITLFSAPNYVYRCGNKAAIMKVDEDGRNQDKIITYDPAPRDPDALKIQQDYAQKIPVGYFI